VKLDRFYIHEMHNRFGPIDMGEVIWVHNEEIIKQWLDVLKYRVGTQLILFNDAEERLYKISVISDGPSVKLEMLTQLSRQTPAKEVYLLWSLLEPDKNYSVIQAATELGVHKLVPLMASGSVKTGFSTVQAQKIIIKAAEQCGRGDIPEIREPITPSEAMHEYSSIQLLVCQRHEQGQLSNIKQNKVAVMIGPNGGWSDAEKNLFKDSQITHMGLGKFALSPQTACVVAVAGLLSG
jgi:16S rRNA (uracil1498-N3)-methyltransferase